MIIPDEKDGNKPKLVNKIVVDGVVLYDRRKTMTVHYNMVDRLAFDKGRGKTIVKEYD